MVQATVDRIEGDFAVLVLDTRTQHTVTLPASILPAGCREGDRVSLTLQPDPDATRRGRERIAGTIDRLTGK
ncbi:MAG: DUF3006 domain-containing protein [Methanoregula sp.]|nr:MAG: DUF3006 domain-containing protein [Methanoregula sp.]